MYGRVVIGVDGRQGGRDACALAIGVASASATLTLTYVAVIAAVRPDTALGHATAEDLAALLGRERELCAQRADCVRVAAGSVAEGLETAAARAEADLIVVGRSRRHGVDVLLAQDDARSVLRASARAVAVAPYRYAEHPWPIRQIGVGVDERAQSEVALAHAGLLAADLHAELRPLTVATADPSAGVRGTAPRPTAALHALPTHGADGGRSGSPGGENAVVRELRRFGRDVDLLVCGSRRPGTLRRALTYSVSERLARRLSAPLLIAPPSDRDAVRRWAARAEAMR